MNKPLIGITGSVLFETAAGLFSGYERMYTNADYVHAVHEADGIPIMLPIVLDTNVIESYAHTIDGLVIMGGYDVDPYYFNEEPLNCLGEILPKRDIFELDLIKAVHAARKPIFGICRGMQILNVAFGGSLYQDISLINRSVAVQHSQKARPTVRTHSITTEDGSMMAQVFGQKDMVNSFHHMAVKDLAEDFKATAKAPDGIIEAIEYTGGLCMVGVQFHPEMLAATHPASQMLFNEFVRRCVKG